MGDIFSKKLQNKKREKIGREPKPAYRLWGTYLGFVTVIAGLLIFTISLQMATVGHWTVTPLIGVAIAGFGNQIITTILVTCELATLPSGRSFFLHTPLNRTDAVDSHPEDADDIGIVINLVRSTWAFVSELQSICGYKYSFPRPDWTLLVPQHV